MKVVWTLEALESLRTIHTFILPKSPQNALKVLNELLKIGDSLTNILPFIPKILLLTKNNSGTLRNGLSKLFTK